MPKVRDRAAGCKDPFSLSLEETEFSVFMEQRWLGGGWQAGPRVPGHDFNHDGANLPLSTATQDDRGHLSSKSPDLCPVRSLCRVTHLDQEEHLTRSPGGGRAAGRQLSPPRGTGGPSTQGASASHLSRAAL